MKTRLKDIENIKDYAPERHREKVYYKKEIKKSILNLILSLRSQCLCGEFYLFLIILLIPANLFAAERIVVLYPAVSPILVELGLSKEIAGTTKTDDTFKNAVKVGTHLSPNVEVITSLKPDLIIAGSKMAFPEDLKQRLGGEVFYYDPITLEEIISKITELGRILNKGDAASKIINNLKAKMLEIKPINNAAGVHPKVSVIYEVTENPLRVAGMDNIVTSIIEAAGGINLIKVDKKSATISIEKVIEANPDFYIYQTGPMNKDPKDPKEREQYKTLKAKFIKVDEFAFSRPGLNSFDSAIMLNKIFIEKK